MSQHLGTEPSKRRNLFIRIVVWFFSGFWALTRGAYRRWWTAVPYTVLLCLFLGWFYFNTPLYWWTTVREVEFLVSSTDSAISKVTPGERVLMVYGSQISQGGRIIKASEGFANEDLFWFWKYGSSDLQGIFREGHTVRAKVAGMRFSLPWLHTYRVIISAEDITPPPVPRKTETEVPSQNSMG